MNNFFPLDRKILNHWVWEDKPFSKGQAWVDLLLLANYRDKKKPINGNIITYKRGSVNLSMVYLADRWGWDRRKVKRFLDALSNDGMVSLNSTTYGTTITIVNYNVFNGNGTTSSTTNGTTNAQPMVQQVRTTNKDKKDKESKKDKYSEETKQATKRIIDYLNEKCGTRYRITTENTIKSINARLAEGYTEDDFYIVIDKKCDEWIGTKWEKFLRPDTLFRPANFESYLNQKNGGDNQNGYRKQSGGGENSRATKKNEDYGEEFTRLFER